MSFTYPGLAVVSSGAEYRRQVAGQPAGELVDLARHIPDLVLDIRYATAQNLLGRPVYELARAYLRRPVAEALARVQAALAGRGLGLCVYDAYRPYHVTVRFYEHVQDETFAAPPWRGSRHNRGASVDVGLVELPSGRPVPLPTDFDELTPAAHARYAQLPAHVLLNRCVLLAAMQAQGFVNYPGEWWHFDHASWASFGLLDLPFEALENPEP
ncbi:M15 family metallopeptidase [Hymenobacter weizhouensis]|uniref:M15 family metallopeptidase n=1 Tax=Hymenobacter sp. YIM 151500-1 TaxID=2987689 RepID=UPI002227979C|nr:M15 family metallopeptidase [Hymenobacter sp. YIM 151500-1]UYZ63428.1 M15 family metallopeptidase [Hymenobacter sp. YIM 151500-1]